MLRDEITQSGRLSTAATWLRGGLVAGLIALGVLLLAPARAHAIGSCPPIGSDTSCGYLITITDNGPPTIQADPSQQAYEGSEDVVVGVQNNSSRSIASLPLSASAGSDLFNFEGDGICDPGTGNETTGPPAPGCQPTPGTAPGTMCGPQSLQCSFPPAPGTPSGYKEPGSAGANAWPGGNTQNGYEGPNNWFTVPNPADLSSGVVNFGPPLAPGGFTYFGLEAPPSTGFTAGTPTPSGPPAKPPTSKKLPPAIGKNGVINLPSNKKCLSKRHFPIHPRKHPPLVYATVSVFVAGKQVGVLRGKLITAGVDLRGLPFGTFVVKIVVVTTSGQVIQGKRTYHTCRHHRLPGHPHLL